MLQQVLLENRSDKQNILDQIDMDLSGFGINVEDDGDIIEINGTTIPFKNAKSRVKNITLNGLDQIEGKDKDYILKNNFIYFPVSLYGSDLVKVDATTIINK